MRKIGSTGRRIFAGWFADYIEVVDVRNLRFQDRDVQFIYDEVNIFFRADVAEALIRPLDKRAAGAQQVVKLFGVTCAAHGPEAAANTARHYGHVVVLDTHRSVNVIRYKANGNLKYKKRRFRVRKRLL